MTESIEYEPRGVIECDKNFIINHFKLIDEDGDGYFRLGPESSFYNREVKNVEDGSIQNPELLYSYFESQNHIEADPLIRPENDATLFTTAGIQHIETRHLQEKRLDRESFIISQPSIRTQYIDKVSEGTTTSFVNFCVAEIRTTPENFAKLTEQYINMLVSFGLNPTNLSFTIEDTEDIWGSKKLNKTTFTVLYDDKELGEGVYLHDYPVTVNELIPIADISFGIERLNWALGRYQVYLQEFENFYPADATSEQKNTITAIIDCIRTACLLVGEGLDASHKNPGRIIRQLSKRFVARNKLVSLPVKDLVSSSFSYWCKWGFKPNVSESRVVEILIKENDRSMNVLLASLLKERGGPTLYMDVNQDFQSYVVKLRASNPPEIVELINEIIMEITK